MFNAISKTSRLVAVVTAMHMATALDAVVVGQIIFSLDNRPSVAIGADPMQIGNGAEDPYGLVDDDDLVRIGPSPSLDDPQSQGDSDGDLLQAGSWNFFFGVGTGSIDRHVTTPANFINAISSNNPVLVNGADDESASVMQLAFSVDRASDGPGWSDQADLNQHPGDIFVAGAFPNPVYYVDDPILSFDDGYAGGLRDLTGGTFSRWRLLDEAGLAVKAPFSSGFFSGDLSLPTVTSIPITPGTHDNVDALNRMPFDDDGDGVVDAHLYFSVSPAQREMGVAPFTSESAIYVISPGQQTAEVFATDLDMGLKSGADDIDALIMYDRGIVGELDDGDFALFSLAPGSFSLTPPLIPTGDPLPDAADIFFTDFNDSFATYIHAAELGLIGTQTPAEWTPPDPMDPDPPSPCGFVVCSVPLSSDERSSDYSIPIANGFGGGTDNVDAMFPFPPGDANLDGIPDAQDKADFGFALVDANGYEFELTRRMAGEHGNVDLSEAVSNLDFNNTGLPDLDDADCFATLVDEGVCPELMFGNPEPSTAMLASLASFLIALSSRQATRSGASCER